MTGGESGEHADPSPESDVEHEVERAFTCTACGFTATHEVPLLQREVRGVCVNCGDWMAQFADDDTILDAVHDAAAALAGDILTERQAVAYLLRDVLAVDREVAADAMESTTSNVDNLQRRAAEKIADARRVVDTLDALDPNPREA